MLTNRRNSESFKSVYNRIKNNIEYIKQDISRLKDIMDKLLSISQSHDIKKLEMR